MKQKLLSSIALVLLLSGCSWAEKIIDLQITSKTATVAKAQTAKPLSLHNVVWFVVTEKNVAAFIEKMKKREGEFVVMVVTPKGYENLSLNLEELRRYLREQKSIIGYYEDFLYEKKEPLGEKKEKPVKK
jgi:hypothetical protein